MKIRIKFAVIGTILLAGVTLFSFSIKQQTKEWVVPPKYKSMKNPTDKADKEGMAVAKQLYAKHCKSCHGKTGLGDGPKSAELDTPSGDFSMEEFQGQTDGELFYKIKFGRDDMPEFAKKIPEDEDIWLVVNFTRTFAE